MKMLDEGEEKMKEEEEEKDDVAFYELAISTLKLQKQQTLPSNPSASGLKPIKLSPRKRDSLDNIDEVSSYESGDFE